MSSSTVHNPIPPEDARRLISAHDGNVALLYIWQSVNGRFDAEAAARDLCMTAGAVSEAKEKLDRLFSSPSSGKVSSASDFAEKHSSVSDDPPQYGKESVKTILASNDEFKSVVEEATRLLGRPLPPSDLSMLLGIYDHLGMPAEVMMELINYCSEVSNERYGTSRRLPVSAIYREASRWAEEGVLSFEKAERYIEEQKRLKSRTSQIAALLKLDTAHITATPLKYLESWAAMGFDDPSILEAYDRTFTKTGALSWKYMDTIMKTWHTAGMHSIKDINEKDSHRKAPVQQTSGRGVNKQAVKDLIGESKAKG